MRFWPRTLGAQLVVVTTLAVVLSNVAGGIWFETTQASQTQAAINERLLDRAASTASLLGSIPARERAAVARTMSSGPWRFDLLYGKPVAQSMTEEEFKLAQKVRAMLPPVRAHQPVMVSIREGALPESVRQSRPNDKSGRIIEVTLPVVRGTQLITTFYPSNPTPWPLEVIIAGGVALLATSAAAAFISRRVARPLSQLAAAASEAARGSPAPYVPEEGPDDVRRAAHAFNHMTDQVRRTLESQRHLLSAVGHDLRTPITAMFISTEFVQEADIRENLQKNLIELQELTDAVLSASRGAGGEQMRKIDLAALVESLCTDMDELGESVSWQTHGAAPLDCRPNEIRRAVRNLIENAVAYGKKADVRLNDEPTGYEIVVDDEGPGIPEADRTRVFEPFVRLEASRNAETGGSGLGLTLVKAIAEGHGGNVALENLPDKGLRVRLRLPREPVAA